MELAPFSFCAVYWNYVRTYSYADKELYSTNHISEDIVLSSRRGYEINLTTGIYTSSGGTYRLLVASPQVLLEIGKRTVS